jgi:hypothetical protein
MEWHERKRNVEAIVTILVAVEVPGSHGVEKMGRRLMGKPGVTERDCRRLRIANDCRRDQGLEGTPRNFGGRGMASVMPMRSA